MARFIPDKIYQRPEGTLLIEEQHPGFQEIYFVPHRKVLELAKIDSTPPEIHKTLLLNINIPQNYLEIFPINTRPNAHFLKNKYSTIKSITLEGIMDPYSWTAI
ncbi:MAG: hypothetical protein D3910_18300 [Candidatus Electrothrix sp. ATG2]|nr:hypothetical protein [Candidatus Electrothrix sp. ATG2]